MIDLSLLEDGFYWATNPGEPEPSLVRLYTNPDTQQRGLGFGIWDGSGFVPESDLSAETMLTRLDEQHPWQKPPIGLAPQFEPLFDPLVRIADITHAIHRYAASGYKVPVEWAGELVEKVAAMQSSTRSQNYAEQCPGHGEPRAVNPEAVSFDNVATVLPDGSAFATMSLPLPSDHWLTAPQAEWDSGRGEFVDTPHPILTHQMREQVVAAARYAIRGATMLGTCNDFDPDAMVQNFVYALCGPFGGPFSLSSSAPGGSGSTPPR